MEKVDMYLTKYIVLRHSALVCSTTSLLGAKKFIAKDKKKHQKTAYAVYYVTGGFCWVD